MFILHPNPTRSRGGSPQMVNTHAASPTRFSSGLPPGLPMGQDLAPKSGEQVQILPMAFPTTQATDGGQNHQAGWTSQPDMPAVSNAQ